MKNRILIMEDSADLKLLYSQVLRARGLEVLLPASAVDAFAFLREEPIPSLILLDLTMPDMSGEQFVEILRAEERWREIPIVLISGRDDIDSYVRHLKVDGGLQKPIELRVLHELIDGFISPQTQKKKIIDKAATAQK